MKTKDNNHHQDNVVQDLCACMAVLVVDVDHGNQKEQETDHNLKQAIDDSGKNIGKNSGKNSGKNRRPTTI